MTSWRGLVLGFVTLASCAGCATIPASEARGAPLTPPHPEIPQCKDGIYNRAANLCVSGGA